MTLRDNRATVNRKLLPPDTSPSRRVAHAGLPAAFFEARGDRLVYRLVLMWRDPNARRGQREEVHDFTNPRRLADLLRSIAATPDRPLIGFRLRAKVRPKWADVTPAFVQWRAEEKERRAHARKGGAR